MVFKYFHEVSHFHEVISAAENVHSQHISKEFTLHTQHRKSS